MKKFKSYFVSDWPVIILSLLSLLIVWPLFAPGFFPHHDNIQTIRIFEMRKCFEDFQLPCRWVPDMGYGYGFPMYNYYSVFPYYIGGLLSFVLGFLAAAKALFFIPLFFGGIAMYLLGKEIFSKEAGFIGAVLYLFAPYRALDSYVRGAIAESFALALVPLLFYFNIKLIRQNNFKNLLGFSVVLAAFLATHNLMTMIFIPVLLTFSVYFLIYEQRKSLKNIILGYLLGFGMAAFFLIPAFFEKSLVQIENLLESQYIPNFRAHFVTSSQLFLSRFWGYGASTWLEADGISFQIGWPHWWLTLITFILTMGWIAKNTFISGKNIFRQKSNFHLILLLLFFFGVSIFFTHNKSAVIWEHISFLQYAQFPWRFLSLTIFCASLLGAALFHLFKENINLFQNKTFFKRLSWLFILIVTLTSVLFNWTYFRPAYFDFSLTEQKLLSGSDWEFQQKGSASDYLPKGAHLPTEISPSTAQVTNGAGAISNFNNRSNSWSLNANLSSQSTIEIPVFDFPNWTVYVNSQKYDHDHKNTLGVIAVNLPSGQYKIEGKFKNTPLRNGANLITVLSVALLIRLYYQSKRQKNV